MNSLDKTNDVLLEVWRERHRQDIKFGVQNHKDGTGDISYSTAAVGWKYVNNSGFYDWRSILLEEVYEALSETKIKNLRKELVQVAAVSVAWIQAIDRRSSVKSKQN